MYELMFWGGGWFITCIMIYYILFYYIRKYFLKYVYHIFVIIGLAVIVWYAFILNENLNIYATASYFTRFAFFLFMLMGAICGYRDKMNNNIAGSSSVSKDFFNIVGLIVSLVAFNGIKFLLLKNVVPYYMSITSMAVLFFVIYYIFRVCRGEWLKKILGKKNVSNIVYVLAMLCLEVYLCRNLLIDIFLQYTSPLRYLLLFVAILLMAILTKLFANIFTAIFSEKELDKKAIFSI